MDPITSIGQVDRTQLPADIRSASKKDQASYAAALQFEQMLMQRLISQGTGLGDESDSSSSDDDGLGSVGGSDAVSQNYQQMLPELLSNAVTSAGGTGLARTLYNSMREQA